MRALSFLNEYNRCCTCSTFPLSLPYLYLYMSILGIFSDTLPCMPTAIFCCLISLLLFVFFGTTFSSLLLFSSPLVPLVPYRDVLNPNPIPTLSQPHTSKRASPSLEKLTQKNAYSLASSSFSCPSCFPPKIHSPPTVYLPLHKEGVQYSTV